jgi:DMSO reductase iron-sulfur subunit
VSRLAFAIDLRRCIGCDTCIIACKVEHRLPPGAVRLKVLDAAGSADFERPQGHYPSLQQHWLPTMCHHCAEAPCVKACPANSLWRRESDGVVMLDADKCIGCQRCEEVCPYDALSFDAASGVADKCDMCADRLAEGQAPSCVAVCPTRAIHQGDLDDPTSAVARLVAERAHQVLGPSTGAEPQIFYFEP